MYRCIWREIAKMCELQVPLMDTPWKRKFCHRASPGRHEIELENQLIRIYVVYRSCIYENICIIGK